MNFLNVQMAGRLAVLLFTLCSCNSAVDKESSKREPFKVQVGEHTLNFCSDFKKSMGQFQNSGPLTSIQSVECLDYMVYVFSDGQIEGEILVQENLLVGYEINQADSESMPDVLIINGNEHRVEDGSTSVSSLQIHSFDDSYFGKTRYVLRLGISEIHSPCWPE